MTHRYKTTRNDKRARRHARIRSKVSGTALCPRLSLYRSNTAIAIQLIDDVSKKTVAAASTREVKSGTVLERAKKAGQLLAKKAKEAGIEKIVFDRSGYVYTGKVKAVADGAREGGLVF